WTKRIRRHCAARLAPNTMTALPAAEAFRGRYRVAHGAGDERDGCMGIRIGRSMREDEDGPLPLPSVDSVVAVELANGDVVPAATAEDRPGGPENLVSDGAALHVDVPRVLSTVAPLANHPVHGVVRSGNEAVQRHCHVPNHTAHESRLSVQASRQRWKRQRAKQIIDLLRTQRTIALHPPIQHENECRGDVLYKELPRDQTRCFIAAGKDPTEVFGNLFG